MSLATKVGDVVENADIDRDTVQPQIHIEERRLSLLDFLKTAIKINGSDVHLQAGSVPMIRVDGRARYLDCPELTDEQMTHFVEELCPQADKREILEKRGAVDLAYPMPDNSARFRTNIFHSRERYAVVMRRI